MAGISTRDHHRPLALPSRLAQPFDPVGMILGPKPGRALADIRLQRWRCDSDSPVQRYPRLVDPTNLTERGSEPPIGQRMIWIGPDRPLRRLDCGLVFAAEIKSQRYVVQAGRKVGVAGIEPDTGLERSEPVAWPSGKDQGRPADSMCGRQIRIDCQSSLNLGQGALVISAQVQCHRDAGPSLRIGTVERDRPSREFLRRC